MLRILRFRDLQYAYRFKKWTFLVSIILKFHFFKWRASQFWRVTVLPTSGIPHAGISVTILKLLLLGKVSYDVNVM